MAKRAKRSKNRKSGARLHARLEAVLLPRQQITQFSLDDRTKRLGSYQRQTKLRSFELGAVTRLRVKSSRLPYHGLRFLTDEKKRYTNVDKSDTIERRARERHRHVCDDRRKRREVLFSNRVAGSGRRRSPGKFGKYKRTLESEMSCKR